MSIDLCDVTRRTVCELNCRLVHADADSNADAGGLSYPSITVDASRAAEDEQEALTGAVPMPVLVKGDSNAQCRLLEDPKALRQSGRTRRILTQLAAAAYPVTAPWGVVRRWLMGQPTSDLLGLAAAAPPSSSTGSSPSLQPSSSAARLAAALARVSAAAAGLGQAVANSSCSSTTSRATSPAPPPLAWHPHKPWLAAADSRGRVQVFDMSSSEPSASTPSTLPSRSTGGLLSSRAQPAGLLGSGAAEQGAGAGGARPAPAPAMILSHPDVQPQACGLAWRPCSGSVLAVGTEGGVAAWSTAGSARAPVSARVGGGGRGQGPAPWVTFFQADSASARYSAVCWSPDGRLLAAASPDAPGLCVWDYATGALTKVGVGLAAFTLLRWSPCGSYLMAAGLGPRFHVWETSRWRYASWDGPPSAGPLVAAAWAPHAQSAVTSFAQQQQQQLNGWGGGGSGYGSRGPCAQAPRVLLLSFSGGGGGGGHLVALHLVQQPPSLVAQLMPVVLPDINLRSAGAPAASAPAAPGGAIADWCWDPRGERLAVLLKAPHPAAGCIALYATSVDPVVHARLLGYARPPSAAETEPGREAGAAEGRELGGPARLAAHQCFTRGALLTLRTGSSDTLYNLPMYFM